VRGKVSIWAKVPNSTKIGWTVSVAEKWRFNGFSKMAAVRPSWSCYARIRTTYDDYSVVSVVVQNLVDIDEVVSIVWNFQYFPRLAWKRLFTTPKMVVLGDFAPKMGSSINETAKRHTLARVRVVWAIKRENPSTSLTCRWVPEFFFKFRYISPIRQKPPVDGFAPNLAQP